MAIMMHEYEAIRHDHDASKMKSTQVDRNSQFL